MGGVAGGDEGLLGSHKLLSVSIRTEVIVYTMVFQFCFTCLNLN